MRAHAVSVRFAALLVALGLGSAPHPARAQAQCDAVDHAKSHRLTHGAYTLQPLDAVKGKELVDSIRAVAGTGRCALPKIRRLMFGGTLTPLIADWIVFVDSRGTVTDGVTQRGRTLTPPVLRGEQKLGLIVFFNGPLPSAAPPVKKPTAGETADQARRDTASLTLVDRARYDEDGALAGLDVKALVPFLRSNTDDPAQAASRLLLSHAKDVSPPDSVEVIGEVLQVRRPAFVGRLLSALSGKLFGGATPGEDPPRLRDSSAFLHLWNLGPGSKGGDSLYLAFGSLPVGDDIWGRLHIHAPPGKRLPGGSASIIANFVNTDRSRIGLSVGVGVLPVRPTSFTSSITSIRIRADSLVFSPIPGQAPDTIRLQDTTRAYSRDPRPAEGDSYVLLHLQAWPRRPWPLRRDLGILQCESVSVFVGTNLFPHDIGSRIPVGVSFDRLWSTPIGLGIGGVLVKEQFQTSAPSKPTERRRPRLFAAMTLAL